MGSGSETFKERYREGNRLILPLIDHLREKGFENSDFFTLFVNLAISILYEKEQENWKECFIKIIEQAPTYCIKIEGVCEKHKK